jgi:hypothetical protein
MKRLLATLFFRNTFSYSYISTSPYPLQRGIFHPRKSYLNWYKKVFYCYKNLFEEKKVAFRWWKSPFEGGREMFLVGEIRINCFKKYLRTLAILFLLINISYHSKAQSISYYPFNSQLSIATNPTKVIWMDFRFQMNSYLASLNTEPTLMVNLAYTGNANFYAGAGANLGIIGAVGYNMKLVNGYFGCFGVRAYPFKEAQKVSINFELSPYVEQTAQVGFFRAWLGVGYHFGGKNN